MGQSCSRRDGSGIRTVNLHGIGPHQTYHSGMVVKFSPL